MKMDLLSVIILMDCYDRTLTVLHAGCLSKNAERRDSRGEVWGCADRMKEAQPRQRTEVSAKNECAKIKAQNTDSGIADILLTFGASVAFRKTYEQVAQFTSLLTRDGTAHPRTRAEVLIKISEMTFFLLHA